MGVLPWACHSLARQAVTSQSMLSGGRPRRSNSQTPPAPNHSGHKEAGRPPES